ncbi:MAG TPA: hypothetical protein VIL65_16385 [Beijerinckiaceae bacterium]|jgi:hypothetical protein
MRKVFVMAAALGAAALSVAGCASRPEDVAASYVSPVQYAGYSCRQLGEEAQAVSSRAAIASGQQESNRSRDAAVTAAAVVVFWPAAFFVGGNNSNTAELARLKGQMEAIESASIQKRCGINFRRG